MTDKDIEAKWDRLWEFFSVSQQFGEWNFDLTNASVEERNIIKKAEEIINKNSSVEKLLGSEAVFNSLTDEEKMTTLDAFPIIVKHMKYSYHGGLKIKKERLT